MKGTSSMGFFTLLLLFWGPTSLTLSSFMVGAQVICEDKQPKHKINTAVWIIDNTLPGSNISLSMQSEECWECDLIEKYMIIGGHRCQLRVDTRWPLKYAFNNTNDTPDQFCLNSFHFQENGVFLTEVSSPKNGSQICTKTPTLTNNPALSNEPIYITLGVLIGISLIASALKNFKNTIAFRRIISRFGQESLIEADSYIQQDLGSPDSINPTDDTESISRPIVKERLKSLDAFRGFSIIIMIFVNYGGGQYWFFKHSPWNGLTVADIVFPWFIFIMGTSMAYSFRSMLRRGMKKRTIFKKIIWRTVVLFVLGIIVNCISVKDIDVNNIRIPGVLQRFAITYLIVSSVHMASARPADPHQFVWWTPIQEMVIYWPDWVVSVILLVIYIAVTFGTKLQDCGTGYIGPAGLSNHSNLEQTTCVGGIASYIDRKVFSDSHIYQRGTFKEVYHSKGFHDPEGILGCLTSSVLCSLGLEAGKIFLVYRPPIQRVKRFLIWAILLGSAALLLTKASKEDGWIPINKNLWSVSFIFATGSLAYLMLTFCYLMIDVWKVWSGSPFYWAGMNAIALYLGHEMLSRKFPVHWQGLSEHWYQLLMNLWGTTFWILIAGFMHYKKTYFAI